MAPQCTYCKRQTIKSIFASKRNEPLTLTWDHYIPLSKGGLRGKVNQVPSCLRCNNLKGNMMPDEWEIYMASNPEWWARTRTERRLAKEIGAPIPIEHSQYILRHGKKAYKEWIARQVL